MATVATTLIPIQKTVTATAVAISRGTRVTLQANGLVSASAIGVRGDYIVLQDIDAAYSMASGLTGVTSTNAVLMGKWLQTTANGALGVIELASVA